MNDFYALPFAQRLYLQRCALSIVYDHFNGSIALSRNFVAQAQHLTHCPLVRAVLWIIESEVSGDD